MADLAHASENDTDLHGDPDAAHWAERFARVRHNLLTGPEHRDIAADEGAMLSWFAGAIETGRMVRETTADAEPLPDWEREMLERQAAGQAEAARQRTVRRQRLGPMPAEFEPLATYNAECWRGLMHTAEYRSAMAALQRRFNEWAGMGG